MILKLFFFFLIYRNELHAIDILRGKEVCCNNFENGLFSFFVRNFSQFTNYSSLNFYDCFVHDTGMWKNCSGRHRSKVKFVSLEFLTLQDSENSRFRPLDLCQQQEEFNS